MSPEERERLVEVMARAVFKRRHPHLEWDRASRVAIYGPLELRSTVELEQRAALAAAERAGFRWIGPDDGR